LTEQQWLKSLFISIDNKDTNAFIGHLSEDCVFRFGNMPTVSGSEAISQVVGGFFDSIKSVSHTIIESWSTAEQITCHGMVTYTRIDGGLLTVPFANIMKMKIGSSLADEYLIFADTSALYS